VVREVEAVGQEDGAVAQLGAQARHLGRDGVHLRRGEEAVLEEVLRVLLDRPAAVQGADLLERRDDAVVGRLVARELDERLAEHAAGEREERERGCEKVSSWRRCGSSERGGGRTDRKR